MSFLKCASSRQRLLRAYHYLDVVIFVVDELLEAFLNDVLNGDPSCHHLLIALEFACNDSQSSIFT